MMHIYNKDGHVINTSRNLAGIRRYVGQHLITGLYIADCNASGEANLYITFKNGATFLTRFADGQVLRDFVSRWRNVYGAPLYINGEAAGVVSARNPGGI